MRIGLHGTCTCAHTKYQRSGTIERLDAPDEISQVREDPVLEQATLGRLALDDGGSDHRGIARKQLATPDDSHEQPERQALQKEAMGFGHGVMYCCCCMLNLYSEETKTTREVERSAAFNRGKERPRKEVENKSAH